MLKFGILDFDTSHAVEFTKRLNHRDIDKDQWVDGGRVVIGCPGESKLSPERIPGFTEAMKKLEVPLVEKPADLIGKVDVMLIEAVDGSVHYERAKPFLEAGIPCFVDKPFTCSVADARKIVDLAAKKKLPLFSSSSLRFAPELIEYIADGKHGKVLGAVAWGPASLHERNPGLFTTDPRGRMLYTLGPRLRVDDEHKDVDVVTGHGRTAASRRSAARAGKACGRGRVRGEVNAKPSIGAKFIYRELLKSRCDLHDR